MKLSYATAVSEYYADKDICLKKLMSEASGDVVMIQINGISEEHRSCTAL